MNKQRGIIVSLVGLFLLSVVIGIYSHRGDQERISELESQLSILRKQEQQSAVDRRVSQQMEELAYGQQTLSEERREEAIRQTEIAKAMTLQSEAERQKAIKAQGIAEQAAEAANDAYQMATAQRNEADKQRKQAEYAKQVADTLNYISLGRTLGASSYSIYQTGDTELGNMLAYASYLYTKDYDGDLYHSSVFPALTQSAGNRRSWSNHNGSISSISIFPNSNELLAVSTYGEFFVHKMSGDHLTTIPLVNDKHYCFRDVYAAKNGKGYAISSTGHLVVIGGNKTQVITVENVDKPFNLQAMNDVSQLLIIGENSVALFDIATNRILGSRRLPFRVISSGRRDYKPLLFDNRGGMHLVTSLDDMTNESVQVGDGTSGTKMGAQVTAFASSKNEHLAAYGMYDGTIWLIDKDGKKRKLVGHLSQITKLKFDGKRLYSSSYDGKLLFWKTDNQQIKPIVLFQSDSWLTDFVFSADKDYIWTGEHNGTVTEYLISLPKITQRLRQNVKRNFTTEEWNYYVGKGIPYRKLISDN